MNSSQFGIRRGQEPQEIGECDVCFSSILGLVHDVRIDTVRRISYEATWAKEEFRLVRVHNETSAPTNHVYVEFALYSRASPVSLKNEQIISNLVQMSR